MRIKSSIICIAAILSITFVQFAFATTYYVRPYDSGEDNGDGTAYARPSGGVGTAGAWNGIDSINWGSISAGDILYICGTHVKDQTANLVGGSKLSPTVNGSAGNWLTIRGDYTGDPGIIWGAYKDSRSGGISPGDWVDNEDGTYTAESDVSYKCYATNGMYEDISDDTYIKYERLASAAAVVAYAGDAGAYYIEDFGTNQSRVTVKPKTPGTFASNVYFSGSYGHYLSLGRNSSDNQYIQFINIHFIAMGIAQSDTTNPYNYIKFIGCIFDSHGDNLKDLWAPYHTSNVIIQGCTFRYNCNLIYSYSIYGMGSSWTISDSIFEYYGNSYFPAGSGDGHGVGFQNGHDVVVEDNIFRYGSSGIDFYIFPAQQQYNITIRRNFITSMTKDGNVAYGCGIVVDGNNDHLAENTYNIYVYQNIVYNCTDSTSTYGYGIFSSRKGRVSIWNNVVNDCDTNFYFVQVQEDGVDVGMRNNISLSPNDEHFRFINSGTNPVGYFREENNLFYPDTGTLFYFRWDDSGESAESCNYTTFKSHHQACITAAVNTWSGGTIGSGSLTSDPQLSNGNGDYSAASDFQLSAASTARDAGQDVGLIVDFAGVYLPQNSIFDIGAYEFVQGTPELTVNIGVSFEGVFVQ